MTEQQLLYVIENAFKYYAQRVPYVYGQEDTHGMDCSGFMQLIHKEAGILIPRTSLSQSQFGTKVELNAIHFGDKLFFDTDGDGKVNHVGMSLGYNVMIHTANPAHGIEIVDINKYYVNHMVAVRRF